MFKLILLSAIVPSAAIAEPTLAQRLCSAYENIETITCEIRKTTATDGKTGRMLSRVFYKKPDHIHVENIAPVKRRIIADGNNLHYYEEGLPRGFSRPISDLSEKWLSSLRNVPGTPMEHLLKLKGIRETSLPGTAEFPLRKAYQAEKVFVVLSCDSEGRLGRIEFFKSPAMKEKTARYDYSALQKVADSATYTACPRKRVTRRSAHGAAGDCWIPCLHKAVLFLPGGEKVTETRRINNLEVNEPIADMMFRADIFFENVDFVSDFSKTYDW